MPTEPLLTPGSERYLVRHTHEIERILRSVMEPKSLTTQKEGISSFPL